MFQLHDFLRADIDINLNEICRLCRNSKGVMSYIFSTTGIDTTLPLSTRIMSFVNIDLKEGDGLPSLICHRCLYHVEQIIEFKIQCEQSDALLRQYLSYQVDSNGFISDDDVQATKGRNREENGIEESGDRRSLEGNSEEVNESDDNGLNCPTCNKSFIEQTKLERHILIHTQDGPFPCDYCDDSFSDKASLRVHWRQEHVGDKSQMCQTCGESFKHRDNLIKHNIRHDKVKPYRCTEPSCSKAFSYRSDLRKHLVIHSGIRPYVCPVCFKAFTRSTNLNKHARVHSGRRPFPCGNCDKMFATRGDLMRHSLIHSGEKPFSCSICCVSFNRKDKLSRHEKLHNEQRAHVCNECPTSFNRKEELTKHIQFHHFLPSSPYEEDSIGANSEQVENGTEALAIENGFNANGTLDSAGKDDDTEDVVINVDPSHWTETKHPCNVCDRVFKNLDDLTKHKLSHEKSRNFICDVCFKGFHQRRELVRHSLTHSGFKPFACETCGKAFSRRDKLTRHMRTHSVNRKVKNYYKEPPTCDICFKVYSSPHELTRHILTHSFYKPYQCSLCTSSYCRKDKLVKHIKSVHSESALNENGIQNPQNDEFR